MTLKARITADIGTVFLNTDEFAETGTLTTAGGASSSLTFIRASMGDLAPIEPGYADVESFLCSAASYAQPQVGDTITDANAVVWIVEPGARLDGGAWSVPVKSDRRVRS